MWKSIPHLANPFWWCACRSILAIHGGPQPIWTGGARPLPCVTSMPRSGLMSTCGRINLLNTVASCTVRDEDMLYIRKHLGPEPWLSGALSALTSV